MTSREIKRRLAECAELFKHEAIATKQKGRTLYKIAHDALKLCEELERENKRLKNPPLPPDGRALPEAPEYKPPQRDPWVGEDRAERIQKFLKDGPHSEEFTRFMRWSGVTAKDVLNLGLKPEAEELCLVALLKPMP